MSWQRRLRDVGISDEVIAIIEGHNEGQPALAMLIRMLSPELPCMGCGGNHERPERPVAEHVAAALLMSSLYTGRCVSLLREHGIEGPDLSDIFDRTLHRDPH